MSKPSSVGGGVIVGLILVVAIILCGSFLGYKGTSNEAPTVEIEDCDAEDWKNYDPDCGRVSPRAPIIVPQKSPAPKRSRR